MKNPLSFLPILNKDNAASFLIWHFVFSGMLLLDFKNGGSHYQPGFWALFAIGPWVWTGKQLFWDRIEE